MISQKPHDQRSELGSPERSSKNFTQATSIEPFADGERQFWTDDSGKTWTVKRRKLCPTDAYRSLLSSETQEALQ